VVVGSQSESTFSRQRPQGNHGLSDRSHPSHSTCQRNLSTGAEVGHKRTAFLKDHSANDAIPSNGKRSGKRIGEPFIALWLGIPIGATVSLTIRGGERLSISRSKWMAFPYAYSRHQVIISVEESLDRVLDRVKDHIDM
jgi:hypothetical protein